MSALERTSLYFNANSTEICTWRFKWYEVNFDQVNWRIYVSLGLNDPQLIPNCLHISFGCGQLHKLAGKCLWCWMLHYGTVTHKLFWYIAQVLSYDIGFTIIWTQAVCFSDVPHYKRYDMKCCLYIVTRVPLCLANMIGNHRYECPPCKGTTVSGLHCI